VFFIYLFIYFIYTVSYKQKDEPDAFKELGTGNRIATWLFYVSKLTLTRRHTHILMSIITINILWSLT